MKRIVPLSVTVVIFMASCERSTAVSLQGRYPPTFVLSGSGKLADFRIYGPKQRNVASDLNYVFWEIQPTKASFDGERVESLGEIRYGVVPNGYKQIYPENDGPPPMLVAGEKYEYRFQTNNAAHARAYFEIKGGNAVELPK